MNRFTVLAVAACLYGYSLAGIGRAGNITYTETFTGSGTLGSLGSFTNALVTITGTANTANVQQSGANFFNSLTLPTVTVAGTGTAALTDSNIAFVSRTAGGDGGYSDVLSGGFNATLFVANGLWAGYNLTTAVVPPVSGNLDHNNFFGLGFGTTQGPLTFTSVGTTGTFGATVPEPASLTLLGIGMVAFLGYRRRRRRLAA